MGCLISNGVGRIKVHKFTLNQLLLHSRGVIGAKFLILNELCRTIAHISLQRARSGLIRICNLVGQLSCCILSKPRINDEAIVVDVDIRGSVYIENRLLTIEEISTCHISFNYLILALPRR